MLAKILLALLLMTGVAFGQKDGLTKSNHYTGEAFRLLGFDTSGTSFLTQAEMNEFVYRAVDQMPAWVWGRELAKQDTISLARNTIYVDSLVSQILHVAMIDSGIIRPLKQRPFNKFDEGFNRDGSSKEFLEYSYFADTIYLYPKRTVNGMDTLRILYYQSPMFTGDSVGAPITMARPFQMGVVYYAVFLAEIRIGRGFEQAAWKRYTDWVQSARANLVRKPVDLYRNEAQQ